MDRSLEHHDEWNSTSKKEFPLISWYHEDSHEIKFHSSEFISNYDTEFTMISNASVCQQIENSSILWAKNEKYENDLRAIASEHLRDTFCH